MTENNKVIYDGQTLIDLTQDDVTASDVRSGVYFHSADGVRGQGTLTSTSIPTADTIAEWDNDVHMNSEDMTSQEVEDFISGLNIVTDNSPIVKVVLWADSAQTIAGYSGVTREGIDVSSSIPSGYTMVSVIPAIAGGYTCFFYTAVIKSSTTVTYQVGNRDSSSKTVTPQLNLICVNNAMLFSCGIAGSVDYIVEQGTSGIWTYRKWNSGIAECWGTYSGNFDVNIASVDYGGYRSGLLTWAFPFSFTETPHITVTSLIPAGVFISNLCDTDTSSAKGYASCGASKVALSGKVSFMVKGKWK